MHPESREIRDGFRAFTPALGRPRRARRLPGGGRHGRHKREYQRERPPPQIHGSPPVCHCVLLEAFAQGYTLHACLWKGGWLWSPHAAQGRGHEGFCLSTCRSSSPPPQGEGRSRAPACGGPADSAHHASVLALQESRGDTPMALSAIRRAAGVLAAAVILAGSFGIVAPAAAPKVLRMANMAEPETLDPHRTSTTVESNILRNLF